MRNFKFTIEYDGTDFSGWQVQPDRRTVQGEFYRALRELGEGDIKVVGAGRTDAGVHASGQVANARMETKHGAPVLLRALNAKLPTDVRVRECIEAPLRFNARFDARSRTYRYIFIRRPSALWRRYFHAVRGSLDLEAMRREAGSLIGERDFTSFASSSDIHVSKRCRIIDVEVRDTFPLLCVTITADHFLHNMVRSVAGTLLGIGRGGSESMREIIGSCDRRCAGPTLPPHGLYLMEVRY